MQLSDVPESPSPPLSMCMTTACVGFARLNYAASAPKSEDGVCTACKVLMREVSLAPPVHFLFLVVKTDFYTVYCSKSRIRFQFFGCLKQLGRRDGAA